MFYKREHCDLCGYTVEFHRDEDGKELPQVGHAEGCEKAPKPEPVPEPDLVAESPPPDDQAA